MLWLGGIALALGGAFLVKVSIDIGLLTPGLRCAPRRPLWASALPSAARLRRRPRQIAIAKLAGNHLPHALSAAGIACLFASIYAAHGLYGLLPTGLAFILLAVTAFVAVGLSLLQGPFLAGLGFARRLPDAPSSCSPSTPGRPAALRPGDGAHLGGLRPGALPGLGLAGGSALAGAIGWALLWTGAFWQNGDGLVFGLYLLALALASVGFRYGLLLPLTKADFLALPGAARFSPERPPGGLKAWLLKSQDPWSASPPSASFSTPSSCCATTTTASGP